MSPTARTGRETPASPDLPDLAEQLAALSRAAVNYVERATGCKLDGSEESLAFVDHYLDEVRKGTPPKPEVLRLIAAALGAEGADIVFTSGATEAAVDAGQVGRGQMPGPALPAGGALRGETLDSAHAIRFGE